MLLLEYLHIVYKNCWNCQEFCNHDQISLAFILLASTWWCSWFPKSSTGTAANISHLDDSFATSHLSCSCQFWCLTIFMVCYFSLCAGLKAGALHWWQSGAFVRHDKDLLGEWFISDQSWCIHTRWQSNQCFLCYRSFRQPCRQDRGENKAQLPNSWSQRHVFNFWISSS